MRWQGGKGVSCRNWTRQVDVIAVGGVVVFWRIGLQGAGSRCNVTVTLVQHRTLLLREQGDIG